MFSRSGTDRLARTLVRQKTAIGSFPGFDMHSGDSMRVARLGIPDLGHDIHAVTQRRSARKSEVVEMVPTAAALRDNVGGAHGVSTAVRAPAGHASSSARWNRKAAAARAVVGPDSPAAPICALGPPTGGRELGQRHAPMPGPGTIPIRSTAGGGLAGLRATVHGPCR